MLGAKLEGFACVGILGDTIAVDVAVCLRLHEVGLASVRLRIHLSVWPR